MTNTAYTLGEWLKDFYEYKANRVKPSTLRNISIVMRCHVPEELATTYITDITATDLENVLYNVKAERMRQVTYQVLNEALERAKTRHIAPYNPFDNLDKIKHKQRKGRALTPLERAKLLNSDMPEQLRLLFEFYLWTGCRRSEALAITWNDIDLIGSKLYIAGTKTETSERMLPISAPLRSVLERLQVKGERLFNYSPDYVSKQFKRYCPRHKLHDLRHTFATVCLESGINMRVVQKWLGHTSIDTTARIYTHVMDDYQRQEALKLHA